MAFRAQKPNLLRRRLRGHPDEQRKRTKRRAINADPGCGQADQWGCRSSLAQLPAGDPNVKRQPKGAKERTQTIQVWPYEQAQAAIPYISSILRSLREHALEALRHYHRAKRIANRPGRPDRTTLIAQQEAEKEAHRADAR